MTERWIGISKVQALLHKGTDTVYYILAFLLVGTSSAQKPPGTDNNKQSGHLDKMILKVIKKNGNYGALEDAVDLAKKTISGKAKALVYPSRKAGDTQTFSGTPVLDPLPEEQRGKFAYGLAIFSDDGCDVSVDGPKPVNHNRFNTNQSLPQFDESFYDLKAELEPGSDVKITVRYSNTIYQGKGDIDGATLFIFLTPINETPAAIKEVSFAGKHCQKIKSDDGTIEYEAPQWVDVNGDGKAITDTKSGEKNYPVAFSSNTKPEAGGKFTVKGLPKGQKVKIRATSKQGLTLPETEVTQAADGYYNLQPKEVSENLPPTIQFYNADDKSAFKIDWEMDIAPGGWRKIGSTRHTVYVTRADPTMMGKNSIQETLFNIGCRNANGKGDDEKAVVDAIYENFKKRMWNVLN